ncbi:threonylcarbamoyl-AMP synthase [Candidatus Peregrinibacteria bacterium]|nr:threonylcarbamoyl-AMP synthase [Candidatus Peregrinibacteria bacterium]
MECLKNSAENIGKAVEVLKKGGVIVHPADTCFGLAGDLMKEDALRKLQEIKGRDAQKPMSIMLPPHFKPLLGEFTVLNDFSEMACEKLFPGPVTIVLPKGPRIPPYFFPDVSTIGIRMPYVTNQYDIMLKYYHPLITTSANLSDQPVCTTCADVIKIFEGSKHQPDLLLDGEIQGNGMPSTVISLEGNQVKILREGPLGKRQLETILGLNIN